MNRKPKREECYARSLLREEMLVMLFLKWKETKTPDKRDTSRFYLISCWLTFQTFTNVKTLVKRRNRPKNTSNCNTTNGWTVNLTKTVSFTTKGASSLSLDLEELDYRLQLFFFRISFSDNTLRRK